jgi:hypothetical protein
MPIRTRPSGAGRAVALAALGAAAGFAVLNPSLLPFLAAGVAAPFAIYFLRKVRTPRLADIWSTAGAIGAAVAALATVVSLAAVILSEGPDRPSGSGPPPNGSLPPPEVVRVLYTGEASFDDGRGWRVVDRMLVPLVNLDDAVRADLSAGGWSVTEREGDDVVYARVRDLPGGLETWPPASTLALSVAEVKAGDVVIRPGEGSRLRLAVPRGMVRETTPAATETGDDRLVVPIAAELGSSTSRIEIDALAAWARPEPIRSLVGLSLLGVMKWLLFGFAALVANELRDSLFDRILRRVRRSRSGGRAAPRPAG